VIGEYSDVIHLIQNTRPIDLQFSKKIGDSLLDKAPLGSQMDEPAHDHANSATLAPVALPAATPSTVSTGQPGRLRRMSLSLGNKSVSDKEAVARNAMNALVSCSIESANEVATVVSMKPPQNGVDLDLHRVGIELRMAEIQQRVAQAEKSFRDRCFVLPDESRVQLEAELNELLKSR